MCGCHTPKQRFIAMASDSKSYTIILWRVIIEKLNIGKKITNRVKNSDTELRKNLACFQTYRTGL